MRLFFSILLVVSLTTGCTTQSPSVTKNSDSASSSVTKNESPDKQVQQTDFVNYDELAELALRVTRFTGPDYSDEQLNNMRKEDWRKDLEEVVRNFANEELLIDVAFMFSLPGNYNPRIVVVGSTAGTIYRINVVKRHNYDGIWTANYYGIVSESNIGTESQNIDYNIITLDIAAPKVKEWAQAYLNSTHGAEEVFISGNANMDEDKTYILLVAEPEASIELLNIRAADQMVVVNYADSFIDEEMYGRQPYVLLEFEAPVLDVFIRKHSSVRIKDIRPYM
ncbi:hypothetical protein ACFSTH_05940 [Paenibacillus yanchengensis]|uniref:Uncharacterized protein n=1 Tax=Paenibacillus yanchengensis TaxID=2035833 RepID=A0ABW4YHA5_9BACL